MRGGGDAAARLDEAALNGSQAEPGLDAAARGAETVDRGLNEAGVPFASNAVTVRGGEGGQKDAAAAISAVPPPIPLAPAAG